MSDMSGVSEIGEEILGGQGYVILPDLMSAADANEARAFAITQATSSTAAGNLPRNQSAYPNDS
jgi:hypothetical protein